MKNLFLLFVIAMIHGSGCVAFAQLTPNTQRYFEYLPTSVNLIKNPSARLNKNNVTATGTVTVTNVAASGNNPSYFTLGAISTLGYAEFALNPVKSKDTSGSCEFKGQYFGTEASKYSARIFNNTTEILKVTLKNTTSDLPGGGPWGEFSVGAPCSSTPKVRIYADAVGLVLNVTNLYYDKATNIGTYTPPPSYTAAVSATGVVTDQTPINDPWISGNAVVSSTDNFAITLMPGKFTSKLNCNVTVASGAGTANSPRIFSSTSSAIGVQSGNNAPAAVPFNIACWKTGDASSVPVVRADQQQLPKTITYTSGSGTYTPTTGAIYIDVEVVGAGSGGAGSGTASQGSGGAGGSTTFGTSLITSSGGGAVSGGGGGGGAGGAGTVNSPAFTIEPTVSVTGQGNSLANPSSVGLAGGIGGDLGYGSGRSGYYNSSGATGPALSGGGGQGGGSGFTAGSITGAGGGSGAKVKARILYPSGNYTYSVGAGGAGGTAGTNGFAGGAGGSGRIVITEYFSPFGAMIIPGNIYVSPTVQADGVNGANSANFGYVTTTVTAGTNVSSVTSPGCSYVRLGTVVTASCRLTITCATGQAVVTMVPPVATTLGSSISGSFGSNLSGETGRVLSSGNNVALEFLCNYSSSYMRNINFTYSTQ